MNAKSFPSSVTSMPIVKIQAARTSAHVRLDTPGMGKRVPVRTCIACYSTIIHRSRGKYPQSLSLAVVLILTIELLGGEY